MAGCAILQGYPENDMMLRCGECAERQLMVLLPVGAKLKRKYDMSRLVPKLSGEVVRQTQNYVYVMWDDHTNSGDHPCEHTTILEKPSFLVQLYAIELPKQKGGA